MLSGLPLGAPARQTLSSTRAAGGALVTTSVPTTKTSFVAPEPGALPVSTALFTFGLCAGCEQVGKSVFLRRDPRGFRRE